MTKARTRLPANSSIMCSAAEAPCSLRVGHRTVGAARLQSHHCEKAMWMTARNAVLAISGVSALAMLSVGLGSVNAARGHFQMAADDLVQARLRWGAQIAGLIT